MELETLKKYLTLDELKNVNSKAAAKAEKSLNAVFISYEIGDKIHFCKELTEVYYNAIDEKEENFSKGLPCFVEQSGEFIPHFFSFSAFRKTSLEPFEHKGVTSSLVQSSFAKGKSEKQIAQLLAGKVIKVVDTIIIQVPQDFVKDEVKTAQFGELRMKPNGEKKPANAHLFDIVGESQYSNLSDLVKGETKPPKPPKAEQ